MSRSSSSTPRSRNTASVGRHVRPQGREAVAHLVAYPLEAREAGLNVLQDLVDQAVVDRLGHTGSGGDAAHLPPQARWSSLWP
jgi:hypothetical protein